MNRKTRFKQQRIYQLKIFFVAMVFVVTIFSGLLAVDVTKSYIFYGDSRFELFTLKEVEKDVFRVSVLDMDFKLNLKYLKKDYESVKDYFR